MSTIQHRFDQFHHANPQVYLQFCKFAHQAITAGAKKLSAKFIFERIRWETMVTTGGSSGFKLNNDFTARYARKFVTDFPALADYFETRCLVTP